MDCKTARLLLDYARPNYHELDETEARALEEHLAGCADCDQQAGAERRADEVIGRAMRAVDVPDQLRAPHPGPLKEERGQRRRRWPVYSLRGALAAAALLLLAVGLWRWSLVRPPFPAERLATQANNWVIAPPSRKQVEEAFKAQGVEMTAPADLNYNYVRFLFLANVEGRPTPTLLFNNKDKGSPSGFSRHASFTSSPIVSSIPMRCRSILKPAMVTNTNASFARRAAITPVTSLITLATI